MRKPLRILMIDDNPDDRLLAMRELRREFTDLKVEEIKNANDLSKALEKGNFDLVITDYLLHWTDGIAILRAVKERWPDRPVIMFTGTGSEEIAVEAMKDGLDDYVIKKSKHIIRLPSAVRSALKRVEEKIERKRMEEELRESEERFRQLAENIREVFWMTDPKKAQMIYVSPAYEEIWGSTCKSLYERPRSFLDSIHPEDREHVIATFEKQARGDPIDVEYRIIRPDGSVRWIRSRGFPVRNELGEVIRIAGIAENITERKNHENQRRLLSDRIMTAQERERTLIARELHDELGQALTGIKMDMAWIKNHMEGPYEAVSQRFVALGELIDSTIESVQEMASSLRPSILDRLGLVAAIEWHAGKFERRTGIECIIESEAPDFKINKKIAINAYRIVQEALTNVARHARASRVDILIAEERGNLVISISDNGRGIASDKLSGPTSLGIAGMRERAELVKGSLDIQSQRGEGTRVIAYFPLSSKGSKV